MPRKTGPAPVPDEVLRRRGGHGQGWRVTGNTPDPAKALPAGKVPATPPRTLGKTGKALWNRARVYNVAWMAESDTETLLLACETADLYHKMHTDARLGRWDEMEPADKKRHMDMLTAVRKQYFDHLSALGFSPADRTRLGAGEVVAEMDDLERFHANRGARGGSGVA